eukprot:m.189844 g.189844  ORF g.189844 m.189844 type:complete len:363 (-) comp17845_c0_seq1:142-1230(-)
MLRQIASAMKRATGTGTATAPQAVMASYSSTVQGDLARPDRHPRFLVLASFRDSSNNPTRPHGLQWEMSATSCMAYVPAPDAAADLDDVRASPTDTGGDDAANDNLLPSSEPRRDGTAPQLDLDASKVRYGIVAAHNLWAFAKGLRFVTVKDIVSMQSDADGRIFVKWAPPTGHESASRPIDLAGAIREDPSATQAGSPTDVWLNGLYIGTLDGPDTVDAIVTQVQASHSVKLMFLRSQGLLRIERYFRGRPRGEELFEHVIDNLFAIEDPQVLDKKTIIGTATLPDWIMGGMLTSRIWVREEEDGGMYALRPLYGDDIKSTDRRYRLSPGSPPDDRRLVLLRRSVNDVRYLSRFAMPTQAT